MNTEDKVDASPVKSFFVQMLTRDIELSDAILDLLDNCIDGILRVKGAASSKNLYKGFQIDISMSSSSFTICDNCGGIPFHILKDYAFRMGRDPRMPHDSVATVGTFGIGMKRAIFKMGNRCEVLTRSRVDSEGGAKPVCRVTITPEWIKDEGDWNIPYVRLSASAYKEYGTKIEISDLNAGTAKIFDCAETRFDDSIRKQIAVTYGFMINKGLKITVNKQIVEAVPMVLKCSAEMSPYVYKSKIGDVDVYLAVGLTAPLLEGDGTPEDGGQSKYSAQNAGWTVMCNDRVVLYADKTILTGWGEAGVPQFHPQYNPICGIVAFNSKDVRQLPTTTTKRGVDASNPIYLMVKNLMREGMRACIKFTNDWKKRESEVKGRINAAKSVSFQSMKEDSTGEKVGVHFVNIGKGNSGMLSKAKLPVPPRKVSEKICCSVSVEKAKFRRVADYLELSTASPRTVIQSAFETVYAEAIES